ncbi:hypothetical protein O7598_27585 [Micromonospora sp. WMMC241]|uniref:hypothetical protein n=1 Tax=Micromonospora sp. WMMC241 TaxID=3015159 RepID=UPI0022B7233E|nr:hypothetical protein [Micromonospora sp. WMMC241]MCZ7440194.1 hypothetical protein [Micromonospora sp. WMMC241]
MTVEEERLRRLLTAQSAEVPSGEDRLVVLHRRITRQRRVRAAGVAAAVVLASSATSVGLVARQPADSTPSPPASTSSASPAPTVTPGPAPTPAGELLPEYLRGHRRVLAREVVLPGQSTVTLTFTPDATDFRLGINCDDRLRAGAVPGRSDHLIQVAVGRKVVGTGDCGSSMLPGPALVDAGMNGHYAQWSELGIRAGKPVTIVVRIGKPVATDNADARPGAATHLAGALGVGVYTPVPFEQFPMPPRPPELVDLDTVAESATGNPGEPFPNELGAIDARTAASPNGSYRLDLAMPLQLNIYVCAVAPGRIRVLVDGKEVERRAFYDWSGECGTGGALASEYDLPPRFKVPVRTGKRVTVTVVADSFTVAGWQVGFAPGLD